jgi:hypothetical protein
MLPTSLSDRPPPDQHRNEGQTWYDIFCGQWAGRDGEPTPDRRVKDARQVERERMEGVDTTVLNVIYGEKKLKAPTNVPTKPVNWAAMLGMRPD